MTGVHFRKCRCTLAPQRLRFDRCEVARAINREPKGTLGQHFNAGKVNLS
jgi:hypothetical protein